MTYQLGFTQTSFFSFFLWQVTSLYTDSKNPSHFEQWIENETMKHIQEKWNSPLFIDQRKGMGNYFEYVIYPDTVMS